MKNLLPAKKRFAFSSPFLLQAAGPVACLFITFFVDLSPGHPQVTRMAGIAVWMALWWITEVVPLAITSLLPVVLFPTMGIMSGKATAPVYFNHIIFLFIGGFLVALAMQRWNLHRRIALRTLAFCGNRPARIVLGAMAATALLSSGISNTATTMMMVPIVAAIVANAEERSEEKFSNNFGKAALLGVAYAASIGGMSTLVGTPPNMAFTQILLTSFPKAPDISFAQWLLFAAPLSLLFLLVVWRIIVSWYGLNKETLPIAASSGESTFRASARMTFEEKVVLVVFLSMALLWMTRRTLTLGTLTIPGWERFFPKGFINDGTVAIALAIVLFLLPSRKNPETFLLDWRTAKDLPWDIVLLFGGGFALAAGFRASGLSLWIGKKIAFVGNLSPIFLVAFVCFLLTFLTEFTSNTATTMMILPILAGVARSIHVHPLLLMIPATLSCSCAFMLPIATPPNAIVFGTGRLRIRDMASLGLLINLVGIVLITAYTSLIGGRILGINFSIFPAWGGS